MNLLITACISIFIIFCTALTAYSQFAGGEGTLDNPYQIETVEQLQAVKDHLDKHFILMNDIDASMTAEWNNGLGFEPIGEQPFSGLFDGNRYSIRDLTVNRPASNRLGLFGWIGFSGTIVDLGVEDIRVTGFNSVGGIAGVNDGTIANSFVNGIVGGNRDTGGITGRNQGSIIGSFFIGSVQAVQIVGGLTGRNAGKILSSYAGGSVDGTSYMVGGLVGSLVSGEITDCYAVSYTSGQPGMTGGLVGNTEGIIDWTVNNSYWDVETTSQTSSASSHFYNSSQGKTAHEMLNSNTFNHWDFTGTGTWAIEEGISYPYHRWQEQVAGHNFPVPVHFAAEAGDGAVFLEWLPPFAGNPIVYNVYRDGELLTRNNFLPETEFTDNNVENFITYNYRISALYDYDNREYEAFSQSLTTTPYSELPAGDGSRENPWLISDAHQLSMMRYNPNGHYRLTADIALDTPPWNEGNGWEPISNFSGSLDGNGYYIIGLTIDRPAEEQVGLFRRITTDGEVLNLGMVDVIVTGNLRVGSLAGWSTGTISGVFATGNVSGIAEVGGLFGGAGGIINDSYTNTFVTGNERVGGLAGVISASTVRNCYSAGVVSNGLTNIGGFVGTLNFHQLVEIINSYWNEEASGRNWSAGGEGKTTVEMLQQATFTDWDFGEDGVWSIEAGTTYPYLGWQGDAGGYNFPQPGNLVLQQSAGRITLNWQPPEGDAVLLGYNVYRDGIKLNEVIHSFTTFIDENVEAAKMYAYYITALYEHNGTGLESGISNVKEGMTFTGFAGGDGSEENPWRITSAEQLNYIRLDLSAHYIQYADIDLGQSPWNTGTGWEPIGNNRTGDDESKFTGSLNGNGFSINNLKINRLNKNNVGLFGYVGTNGIIRDVTLHNVEVKGGSNVGAVAGTIFTGSIINSSVTGTVLGDNRTGGIAGELNASSSIDSSFSRVDVTGNESTGGLVGLIEFTSVTNSRAEGNVYGSISVGGLVGYGRSMGGIISDCSATGDVTGTLFNPGSAAGGVGGLGGSITVPILNSYATGDVTGPNRVGGLVGTKGYSFISNSYATGDVSGTYDQIGGLVGYNYSPISNSYATGNMSGSHTVGGLIGRNTSDEITNVYAAGKITTEEYGGGLIGNNSITINSPVGYWNIESTGQNNSVGGGQNINAAGLTTSQMLYSSNYIDWDFTETWDIIEGETYPWLRENPQDPPPKPVSTSVPGQSGLPLSYELFQNYPNPFNPSTIIRYSLPGDADVSLIVYDLLGRQVAVLVNERQKAGYYDVDFNAANYSSGMYLYRLNAGNEVQIRRMLYVK
jgi:hypothetical protein